MWKVPEVGTRKAEMWATGRELGLKGQGSREVRLASAQSWGPLVLGHILVYQGYMYVSRERNPFFFSPNPCKSSNLQEQRGEGVPPPPEPRWPISFHRRNPIIALRSPTLPRHSQSTKLQVNLSSEHRHMPTARGSASQEPTRLLRTFTPWA